jgi:hypothetical protein
LFIDRARAEHIDDLVDSLNGHMIDQQRPLLVKFADDDKRRRQLMARYLPQLDSTNSPFVPTFASNLHDSSDVLSAQLAQLNLIANSHVLPGLTGQSSIDTQQQGQDMNLLMNTLLMMPFWSNMCATSMSIPTVSHPLNANITNKTTDRFIDNPTTTSGASVFDEYLCSDD